MPTKLFIQDNHLVLGVASDAPAIPKSQSRYEVNGDVVTIYHAEKIGSNRHTLRGVYTDFLDSNGIVFGSLELLTTWLRANTAFSDGGGNGDGVTVTELNNGLKKKLDASDYIIQLVTADGGATITGNNTSLDFQGVIPKTINVLFPATLTNFTETSTINIAGTGAIVVTGELGFPISKADIVLDRVYSMLYNSSRNKFEVQGVSSMLILESELMSSSVAPFFTLTYTGATFVSDGANASAISPGCRKIVSASGVNSGVFFGSELDTIRLVKDSMHKSIIKPLTLTNGITRCGALDDTITPLNGVYLEINHTTGVMSFVAKNSTTGTTTNVLGITASVKFYKVFTQIKATTVELTVTDNTLAVLATSSISTNIPYGKAMGTGIGSISLTGVKDMLSIDYHGYAQNTLR